MTLHEVGYYRANLTHAIAHLAGLVRITYLGVP